MKDSVIPLLLVLVIALVNAGRVSNRDRISILEAKMESTSHDNSLTPTTANFNKRGDWVVKYSF